MTAVVNIILTIITIIVLAIAGGFSTDSARRLANLSTYNSNKDLQTAHKYLTIAAIICWVLIAILIVAAILLIFFSPEEVELSAVSSFSFTGLLTYLFLFLALGGTLAVAILSSGGSYYINKSGITDNNLTYRNAIIGAVLASIGFVGVVILLVIKWTYKPKVKEDKDIPSWMSKELDNNPSLLASLV